MVSGSVMNLINLIWVFIKNGLHAYLWERKNFDTQEVSPQMCIIDQKCISPDSGMIYQFWKNLNRKPTEGVKIASGHFTRFRLLIH